MVVLKIIKKKLENRTAQQNILTNVKVKPQIGSKIQFKFINNSLANFLARSDVLMILFININDDKIDLD